MTAGACCGESIVWPTKLNEAPLNRAPVLRFCAGVSSRFPAWLQYGSYVVVQCGDTANWDWDEYQWNRDTNAIESKSNSQPFPYNYMVFGVVRDVAEDDPQESAAGAPSQDTIIRQSEKNAEAQTTLLLIKEEDAAGGIAPEQANAFQKIRYSEKIPHGQVWKPYFDSIEGVFVCVNKKIHFISNLLVDSWRELLSV